MNWPNLKTRKTKEKNRRGNQEPCFLPYLLSRLLIVSCMTIKATRRAPATISHFHRGTELTAEARIHSISSQPPFFFFFFFLDSNSRRSILKKSPWYVVI